MSVAIAVAALNSLQQQNMIERGFHDALFPKLLYRQEASVEEWPANTGNVFLMSKPGLLPVDTTPLVPGSDPPDQQLSFEQWFAFLQQYGKSINTHVPSSVTAAASVFYRNIQQLGMQSGQTVNRLCRDAMFTAYLGGATVALTTIASADTTIRVASLNGFTTVVNPGGNVQPTPVSPTAPLPATVGSGSGAVKITVIGATPDNSSNPNGPGTLTLQAAVGTAFLSSRATVTSNYVPTILRSSGGDSVDSINAADTLTLQQCITGAAFLEQSNVPKHEDGYYHVHISSLAAPQFFADPVFQRLHQSLPESDTYQDGFMGTVAGLKFFRNNESPLFSQNNAGNMTNTSGSGVFAKGIGGEVVNGSGVQIGRALVTGKGAVYERRMDESQYVTEAGTTGKIGAFDITNMGVNVVTEGIRLILRAPIDKLQQFVTASWTISTSFSCQTDILAQSGPQAYKRAIILEHAA